MPEGSQEGTTYWHSVDQREMWAQALLSPAFSTTLTDHMILVVWLLYVLHTHLSLITAKQEF